MVACNAQFTINDTYGKLEQSFLRALAACQTAAKSFKSRQLKLIHDCNKLV